MALKITRFIIIPIFLILIIMVIASARQAYIPSEFCKQLTYISVSSIIFLIGGYFGFLHVYYNGKTSLQYFLRSEPSKRPIHYIIKVGTGLVGCAVIASVLAVNLWAHPTHWIAKEEVQIKAIVTKPGYRNRGAAAGLKKITVQDTHSGEILSFFWPSTGKSYNAQKGDLLIINARKWSMGIIITGLTVTN
ncbi:hypothetical protein A9Q78_08370 [Methylophaga sp. 41_12_T18]|nr:hypothetical protein A9Q78_08370 [Methylophaga sp. 41_12_T18]